MKRRECETKHRQIMNILSEIEGGRRRRVTEGGACESLRVIYCGNFSINI
jgi:hypothetical protein